MVSRAYQLCPDEDDDDLSCSDREADPAEIESSKETKCDVEGEQSESKNQDTEVVKQSEGTSSQVEPAPNTLTEFVDTRCNSAAEDDLTSSDGSVTIENV